MDLLGGTTTQPTTATNTGFNGLSSGTGMNGFGSVGTGMNGAGFSGSNTGFGNLGGSTGMGGFGGMGATTGGFGGNVGMGGQAGFGTNGGMGAQAGFGGINQGGFGGFTNTAPQTGGFDLGFGGMGSSTGGFQGNSQQGGPKKLITFDSKQNAAANDDFGTFVEAKPKNSGMKNFSNLENDLIDLSELTSEANKKKNQASMSTVGGVNLSGW